MGYEHAVAHLDSLGIDAMKSLTPSLHRIQAMCDALDHPEQAVPAIHIGGTNGKTTTARIAASLLSATGISVGTFTSPHLQSVTERIALGGTSLAPEDFGDVYDHLAPFVEMVERELGEPVSYFETLTAMYFLWAAETVDVSVIEVGLGGRWDATNVVRSAVSVITNVGLDHTDLLGKDRPAIASEKAGIIKAGNTVVTAERSPEIVEIVQDTARRHGADVSILDRDFEISSNDIAIGGRYLDMRTSVGAYEGVYLPLHGAHQGINAATALEAVSCFLAQPLDPSIVAEAFSRVEVPGRLETIRLERESVVLDVAHNPDGMATLVDSLRSTFPFQRVRFVFGALWDKDHEGMLREMARLPCRIVATEPDSGRARDASDLRAAAEALGIEAEEVPRVEAAVDLALRASDEAELVCVTGSHYVVGQARTHLLGPPIA